jgi:hypothetical protein
MKEQNESVQMNTWQPIETAPKDGSWFEGSRGKFKHRTQWGKTSHVPLYGWCFISDLHDGDPDYDLWYPTHWRPLQKKGAIT